MNFIRTLRLGDIELTIIGEGTLYGDPALVFKDMDESIWRNLVTLDDVGRLVFSLNLILVRTQNRLVLLDTGIGEPNKARQSFEVLFPFKSQLSLLDALNILNINRMDITDVVFSHVHADHIMGATIERNCVRIPSFPNAMYLMHEADGSNAPEQHQRKVNFNLHIPILKSYGLFGLIKDQHRIAPGLTAIHAPGESSGHILVRLESKGLIAYYVGDLFHHACEAEHIDFVWPGRNRKDTIESRRNLISRAIEEDALIITAHTVFPGMAKFEVREGKVFCRNMSDFD
ncbi:MAG: putative quorum-quenching lactonase YtnP [Candidatus Moanabacter tarae]|uniref:Putative quorum-quenching lactonase YtnP n=1 Tax=Candidatus Moanibacter tarae TaxID=2200854 RepID=A0A2Z4AHU1_9BACT|nr:MAG: putative quorum-quenching lactonase YtnP [Candidatus Moanabacter tarae]|tara:strand:+ start:2534 stop:3394 length:861 start_codon:yes stop_codon:yes gene_type:complete